MTDATPIDRATQVEILAAALMFYQHQATDRITGVVPGDRPFDPVLAVQEWVDWRARCEIRGMTQSLRGHRQAAERVLLMVEALRSGAVTRLPDPTPALAAPTEQPFDAFAEYGGPTT